MVIEITAFQFLLLLVKSYFTDFIPSFRFVIDLGLEISKLSLFFFLYCMFFFTLYSPFFFFHPLSHLVVWIIRRNSML
jgi:hypothetical protein